MRLFNGIMVAVLSFIPVSKVTAEDNSLTIYSSSSGYNTNQHQQLNPQNIPGFAVVKQSKTMAFKKGSFELIYDDVTAYIDPTTVSFSTPNNTNAAVLLDQNYQYDLVGSDSLLQKYINKNISVSYDIGGEPNRIDGQLLSTQGGLIIQNQDGSLVTLRNWSEINFPQLPGGLLTKPTLVWLLDSNTQKDQLVAISYQTAGMTWWADYIVELNRDKACEFNLSAWVSIVNQSGKSFEDYGLKLVAGNVNQASSSSPMTPYRENIQMSKDQSFQQESVFEYHQYKLPRSVNLPQNSTKQIRLFAPEDAIQCKRELLFDPFLNRQFYYARPINDANYLSQQETPVTARIHFKNNSNNNLGVPLPAGRVRVNQADSDGHLTFIGADRINHTANNQTVSLTLGNSFDVNGERNQTDFKLAKNQIQERFEIKLTNGKKTAETVTVREPLYRWSNWQISDHSHEYKKINAQQIEFKVEVPAESEILLNYSVLYQWPNYSN